jgi:hypothetical protein
MDKTGVCPGEGEAPKPGEKAAQDATKVGGDLQSRMVEMHAAIAEGRVLPFKVIPPPEKK